MSCMPTLDEVPVNYPETLGAFEAVLAKSGMLYDTIYKNDKYQLALMYNSQEQKNEGQILVYTSSIDKEVHIVKVKYDKVEIAKGAHFIRDGYYVISKEKSYESYDKYGVLTFNGIEIIPPEYKYPNGVLNGLFVAGDSLGDIVFDLKGKRWVAFSRELSVAGRLVKDGKPLYVLTIEKISAANSPRIAVYAAYDGAMYIVLTRRCSRGGAIRTEIQNNHLILTDIDGSEKFSVDEIANIMKMVPYGTVVEWEYLPMKLN